MAALTGRIETAEIVAVGSELLTAHRIDTNSLYLTGALNALGIVVAIKHVVGDRPAALRAVLQEAVSRADVVITTGGLGPTDDDLTREVVAETLGLALHGVPEILEIITQRFARRGARMPEVNRRQARVIDGARWLPNTHGTAPGQIVTSGNRLVILLPGPPSELEPMFEASVAPVLAARAGGRRLRRRVLKTTGRSESQVEELAQPVYAPLVDETPPIETTILASPGLVELHLSCSGDDEATLDAALDRAIGRLTDALGDAVFSSDGRAIEDIVGALLVERGWRVAAAESCTGGQVLQRLTDVPGSSAWVLGGVVAYDNAVKVEILGVPDRVIATDGAVSDQVALAMADGVRSCTGAEIGIGVTGIAGPGGGSPEKPVGTVFVAVTSAARRDVRQFLFPGTRAMVRTFSAAAALDMVRRHLQG
ncbi:MAG: competence/damage-inducible protein A [Acidobacteria bacterium SCN 69-37]|nr:MAG: competence/damage-inducible protein A [Acidobacteria bacterium SCN 69-37]